MPLGIDTYTKLLMHCEGTDASTTFIDGSPTHRTLTSKGSSAQIDTAQYKFGAASGLFNAGYVYAADSDDWYFDGSFTLDLWIRHSSLPASGSHQMYLSQHVTTNTHWNFRISNTSGNYYLRYEFVNSGSSVASFASSYITIATGAWHHIALVRNGSAWDIYYDGVDVGGGTDADSLANLASSLYVGSWGSGGGYYFYGWMDEVRISKGIARWTGEFTPPEEAYWLEDSITDALTTHDEAAGDETDDEVDSTVKLLLHGEGADASTTIKDSSPSHLSGTALGNAQIDTAQKKFGGASILFDGTSDAVRFADSADWQFGTGDFTIDLWARFAAVPPNNQYMFLLTQYESDTSRFTFYISRPDGVFRLNFGAYFGGNTLNIARSLGTLVTDTWYHFAVTRAGQSVKLFVDGQQLSTEYLSSVDIGNINGYLYVGARDSLYSQCMNGWIDELRIVKGKAIWTASFTPPTAPYALLEHKIEELTTSEAFIPDPGLPTDADFTEIVNLSDTFDYIAGIEYFGEIDEDIALEDIVTPNVTYDYNFIDATAQFSGSVVNGNASYGKILTEALTAADTVEGQYNITMWGSAQFPLFETAAYTGLGFNSGDMNFPVFEGVAYTGARSSNQEHPKFGLSGTMQIQYPFGQDAIHPKFSGTAAMTVGKVVSGDANFPLFSGTGTMVGNPQLTGDIDFPVFGGNGGMSVGGRFANYVLRYVR